MKYGYLLQAHTDGDLYVLFPDSNVLVAGGVVSSDGWPVIDYKTGGWLGGLIDGLKELIKVADANTQIVPANGPVVTRADLEAQRDMYAAIFDRMEQAAAQGHGAGGSHRRESDEGIRREVGRAHAVRDAGVQEPVGPHRARRLMPLLFLCFAETLEDVAAQMSRRCHRLDKVAANDGMLFLPVVLIEMILSLV